MSIFFLGFLACLVNQESLVGLISFVRALEGAMHAAVMEFPSQQRRLMKGGCRRGDELASWKWVWKD